MEDHPLSQGRWLYLLCCVYMGPGEQLQYRKWSVPDSILRNAVVLKNFNTNPTLTPGIDLSCIRQEPAYTYTYFTAALLGSGRLRTATCTCTYYMRGRWEIQKTPHICAAG